VPVNAADDSDSDDDQADDDNKLNKVPDSDSGKWKLTVILIK